MDEMRRHVGEAAADAQAAFMLLLDGRAESGLPAYKAALRHGGLTRIPTGVHVLMLEKAGREGEAEALRRLALAEGADLAVRAGSIEVEPGEAAAEYEALIPAGSVNARMVFEYLDVLGRLDRAREVAAFLRPELLLRRVKMVAPDPNAVADALLGEEGRHAFREADESIRRMTKVRRLQLLSDPAIQSLIAELRGEAAAYCEAWRQSDHPLAALVPRDFDIRAWGLVSRGEGFNLPHIHHRGWATGVYYPARLPTAAGEAGCLKISVRGADVTIRPEPGLLVLMPSYYTHWTVPLGVPGLRMSVAFDLVADG